jgi:hypothetical protein
VDESAALAAIDALTHEEMARLWRYAPPGHPYFDRTLPYFERFKARFDSFGGFNPALSKRIDE